MLEITNLFLYGRHKDEFVVTNFHLIFIRQYGGDHVQ